jgi:PAS domain S-box-containing protein
MQLMLHELRVYQIELEMQNEEPRTAQAVIDAERARYFALYDLAPVGFCTVSEKGLILEANLTAATLLGTARSALLKQPITRFILKADQDIYYQHQKQLRATGEAQECELRLVRPDGALFWAHLAEIAAQVDDGAPVRRVTISDISVRKQAELAQRRLHEENTRLGREMIRLQEVERTNLARELHDGLSQQLVAIRAYAGAIRRAAGESKAAANAAAIEAAVSEIYAASHRMLEGLHPQILDGAGLHAAVGLLLTGHAEAFPETRIWLRSAGNVELMDPGARISLFRVVQECLTNATAHSGARRIRVFLGERQQSSGPRLRLVVRDDGRGADLSVEHAGYGLIVMRERVRAMGGQLSFSSRPGQGLRVMADVPAGSRGP